MANSGRLKFKNVVPAEETTVLVHDDLFRFT